MSQKHCLEDREESVKFSVVGGVCRLEEQLEESQDDVNCRTWTRSKDNQRIAKIVQEGKRMTHEIQV